MININPKNQLNFKIYLIIHLKIENFHLKIYRYIRKIEINIKIILFKNKIIHLKI